MRLVAVFRVSLKQQVRDRVGLVLTIATAPFFVLVYWVFFGGADAVEATAGQMTPFSSTPFQAFVPGLLVFSVIMIVFSSAMSVAREVEWGTLTRIRLTPTRPWDILAGISGVQLFLGLISFVLTIVLATLLGFESRGALGSTFLIGGLACLASVGLGMVVASVSRTTNRAFLIAGAVMFLLILFSGVIYPHPTVHLLTLGGQPIGFFDILPTTHMRIALGKVLTLGVSLHALRYELGALTVLSVAYFALGVLLFARSSQLEPAAPKEIS